MSYIHHDRNNEQMLIPITVVPGGTSRGFYFEGKNVPKEWLPAGSSAIAAVVDDLYMDRVDKAVTKATRKVTKAIDNGDHDAVVKAVNEGNDKVIEAAAS